ncbi:MAG: site-2 protease family protein [Spirulina sp. SIO3F2]|nr:site-2 protease family protein [Spirulina sp. SIO3F2]
MFILSLFTDPIYFIQVICIVILSIVLHELGHGWTALKQGDRTPLRLGHMTFNPVVHMGIPSLIFLCITGYAWGCMPVDPSRFRDRQWGQILVSAAGPFTNLAIAIVMLMLMHVMAAVAPIVNTEFFYRGAQLNFVLFMFNLLPCPPLDGFTIASEFFPALQPFRRNPNIGLLCLILLYQIPGLGSGLWQTAEMLTAALATS